MANKNNKMETDVSYTAIALGAIIEKAKAPKIVDDAELEPRMFGYFDQ